MNRPVRERALGLDPQVAVERLLAEPGDGPQSPESATQWRAVATALAALFHHEFLAVKQRLRRDWDQLDPDLRRSVAAGAAGPDQQRNAAEQLAETLRRLLRHANFTEVPIQELTEALRQRTLFGVSVRMDLKDYEELAAWRRREVSRRETVSRFFGLRKRQVDVPVYDRFCVYARFKGEDYFSVKRQRRRRLGIVPGGVVLRLFKNVPKHDVETLFPGVQVRMRTFDRALIGLPAAAGFIHFVVLKLGASLTVILLTALFAVGLRREEPDWKQAWAAIATLGVLLAFLFRQWMRFLGRKNLLHRQLAEHLQTCTLDTGVGVLHHLLDKAEDEETLEALLAWTFLVRAARPMTLKELDLQVEAWLERELGVAPDFEEHDALRKLERLGLVTPAADGTLVALPPAEALARLRTRWGGLIDGAPALA